MEAKQAQILLEKYWAGESSVAEETTLREWFRHGRVPEELEADKEYFLHMNEMAEEAPLDQYFDDRIMALIDEQQQQSWSRRFLNVGLRVAAVMLLAAGAFGIITQLSPVSQTATASGTVIEVEDPGEALAMTQDAFMLISEKLGKGQDEAQRLSLIGTSVQSYRPFRDRNAAE